MHGVAGKFLSLLGILLLMPRVAAADEVMEISLDEAEASRSAG